VLHEGEEELAPPPIAFAARSPLSFDTYPAADRKNHVGADGEEGRVAAHVSLLVACPLVRFISLPLLRSSMRFFLTP